MKYPKTFTIKVGKEEVQKKTVWGMNAKVCQTCNYHRNNPSKCIKQETFVNRKAAGCKAWKRK